MFDAPFTEMLLILLGALLLVAAVIDVRTFTISNKLNLTVALLAPVYWLSIALPLWPDAAIQLGAGAGVFALLALAFFAGMMGGGDVKLLTALALWVQPVWFLKLVVVMAIVGGVLTLVCALWHFARGKREKIAVPYGIAISAAGLWVLASQHLPTIQSGVQSGLRSAFQSG